MNKPDTGGQMQEMATERDMLCRLCRENAVVLFYEVESVPAHNSLLLESLDAARDFPRGDLRLGYCPSCGFVQNVAYDERRLAYGPGYEDSQANSARFVEFATELANGLIERHDLRDRDIVEVGCGKADFLGLLCRLGGNRGLGFDPVVDAEAHQPGIDLVPELFDEHSRVPSLDLLVCRHTLEHVPDVAGFVAMLGHQLARHPGAVGYLEVPDVRRVLREGAFWDLYYEHCSYFTLASLSELLVSKGLCIVREQLGFDDQYIQVEFRAGDHPARRPGGSLGAPMATEVARFVDRMTRTRSLWRDRLDALAQAGRCVLLWGGGSKAVGFLTTLGIDDEVAGVVDINPRKQGRYLPGSGHRVLAPDELDTAPPDVVVVMNPTYLDEVRDDLRARGLDPEVLAA